MSTIAPLQVRLVAAESRAETLRSRWLSESVETAAGYAQRARAAFAAGDEDRCAEWLSAAEKLLPPAPSR